MSNNLIESALRSLERDGFVTEPRCLAFLTGEELREDEFFCSILDPVTNAFVLALYAHWRRLLLQSIGCDRRACDLFLLRQVSPSVREHRTQIGGVPHRPSNMPWPRATHGKHKGEPMVLVAQWDFGASRDLFPELPGDVLLMYSADPEMIGPDNPEEQLFEWQPAHISQPIRQNEVPRRQNNMVHYSTERWRYEDLAVPASLPQTLEYVAKATERPGVVPWCPEMSQLRAWRLAAARGIKIGGMPSVPFWNLHKEELDPIEDNQCQYLASFCSICFGLGPYPWIDVPAPLDVLNRPFRPNPPDSFELYDGFSLDLWVERSGQIHYTIGLC